MSIKQNVKLEDILNMSSRIGDWINEREVITNKKDYSIKKGKSIKQKLDQIVKIIGNTLGTKKLGSF